MFSSKLYRTTAAIVGVGSCGWYVYHCSQDMKERFGASLKAASPQNTETFPGASSSFQRWDDNWDKRKTLNLDKDTKPTATRHYILIRHGQYNLNGTNDSEKKLTSLGKEQAEITGKRLEVLLSGLNVEKIFESTMTRAKETSSIIQKSLPGIAVSQTDLLREGPPIRPAPSNPAWEPAEHEFFAEGARIEAAFRKHFHRASPKQEKDSIEVYVCHANVIRYIACRALQFPPEGWLRIGLRHCSITWITVRPNGKVSLRCLGDAGHLPPDKLTFN